MAVILFGFQTAIGNVQTLPSDLFSGKTVGTLAGFSGMAAKLGAVGLTSLVPWLTADGNYTPAFVIGASLAIMIDAPLGCTPAHVNANKDLGYFLEMVKDLNTESKIAEGTSSNLQASVDAGMGNGNVPEIMDYFLKLEK